MTKWIAVLIGVAAIIISGGSPALAGSDEFIGAVKKAEGDARIEREGKMIPADMKRKLYVGDKLVTGADGRLGVLLRDNTALSIGPKSNLALNQFIFVPNESKRGLLAKITKGTACYVSGKIGKLSPASVRLETPDVSIGIRGTKLLIKVD